MVTPIHPQVEVDRRVELSVDREPAPEGRASYLSRPTRIRSTRPVDSSTAPRGARPQRAGYAERFLALI